MSFNKIITFTFLVSIFACSKKFVAPKPEEFYKSPETLSELSNVNIITTIAVSDLQKQLNSQVPVKLYEDNNIEDDNYMITVSRRSDIQMVPKGSLINFKIPLNISGKARLKLEQFGLEIKQEKDASFAIDINYVTKITATPDWKLITRTSSNGYNWITKPTIKLGIIDFNVAPFLEKILDEQQDNIAKEIDKQVADKLSLKEHVIKAWETIQTPFSISDEYNAWVKISPQEVFLIAPYGDNQSISTGIGVKGIAETFLGKKPEATIAPLPPLKIMEKPTNEFSINLISKVSMNWVSDMAKKNFKDKTFSSEDNKKAVKIEDIDLFGSGEKIIVKALMSGSFNGVVYLSGTPVYDTVNAVIKFKNMDFDIQTKNKLYKTANWLAHDYIMKKLQPLFVFPVKQQLEEAKTTITKNLTNNKVNNFLTLNGKVNDINPRKLLIVEDYFLVLIEAKGNLNLNVSGF